MSQTLDNKEQLDALAKEIRYVITDIICRAGSGHIGGALSLVEIMITLYYRVMNVRPSEPRWDDRDRFILSKGHAGPVLYTVLAYKGYFPMSWLPTLNKNGTNLPSHVDQLKTPGVDMTAGSLGQGISAAVGIAEACRLKKKSNHVFCIVGDGESQEGQVWEASMYAAHRKLDNLIAILDCNRMQIDGTTDEINSLGSPADKWRSFGWEVFEINGHDWDEILSAVNKAKEVKGKPSMIVAHTVKAKGNACVEGTVGSHNIKVANEADYKKYLSGTSAEEIKLPY